MSERRIISTRIEESGAGRLEIDAAELRVVAGPDRGACAPLGADTLVVGSAADCSLVLHDETVSARHAEIRIERGGYRIRDLGSKNGILLGGWPIDRAPLTDRMRLRLGRSELEVRALGGQRAIPLARAGQFGALVAHSVKMRAVVAALEPIAAADSTVLLEGETGTGKEVVAQELHAAGRRAAGPFVVVDCGALAPTLVAAELFGHERGAFSGATDSRPGLFEQAHRGILFCDEIGELPLEVQAVMLRAIDRKTVRRLGGARDLVCDVRVVAATNRNLDEEVASGRFRKDLYYRLAVARVRLPALRERPEDILVLAQQFAAELGATLTPELLALLPSYRWPGNVRELRNLIARLAVQPAGSDPLAGLLEEQRRFAGAAGEKLPPAAGPPAPLGEARQRANDEFERQYLTAALASAGGNVSRAAEQAGVSRQAFTRLLAKHRLRGRDHDDV